MVENRSKEFDIILTTDVIASKTDGASAMVKFGHVSFVKNLLCLNNGIHFAGINVVYKKI